MPTPFIHLHVHSHYSLLQALPKPDELVKAAKNAGMDAVALTDYGAVYGVIEFIQECRKKEIKPIIGQCINVALDKYTDKRPRIDDKSHQLVILCETNEGYGNLLKLTTIAHLEGFYYKARMDKELLRSHAKGLIGLSGGMRSEICKALAMDEIGKAEAIALEYRDIFGEGNFFLEIQDHPELDDQQSVNRQLIEISKKTGIPLVATKDVHYLKPDDSEAHDVLLCIGDGKTLDDDRRSRMTDADYSFVSSEYMEKAFAHVPEAIANTRRIADRCNVNLELGKWNFANIDVPEGETHDTWLRKLTYAGISKKVPEITQEITDRIEYELGIIQGKGYSPYFLVVSDYMRWSKDHGIMTTTRGSAAGSLVSYAIDIVPVNPLTYKLPFERFLNPFRPSPPDIDGDFEDTRRDEVIAYVTEKYGKDKVAQIGTFGTMAARGSVRDVGRVLGLPYPLCDRISKMIPMGSQGFPMTIARAIESTPELREEMSKDPDVKRLLALAQRVEGSARHVSVHAAGVVIAPKPLTEYTALQKESGGEKLITQYEMHSIEEAGVLKSDFLGIRNLSILGGAVKIIKKTKGVGIDLHAIPLDDARTYKMLTDGETTGLFQLNGAGMTRYLKELKPSSIHDIMAMVALFRPGPMDSIPDYIRRKNNPELVTYLDPRLKPILEKSYGIMTYQDDVLLTAINVAGYNWEEADKFRKAMGKKIPEEMAKQEEKFKKGCVKGGTTSAVANELWELIKPFAAYGFNKAHACAYGMVAYQTSYLKANWPAEYMTAVLSAESGDADTVATVVADCAKMGIRVLPPDVNESESDFTYIDDAHIRFGLLAIKNLGTDVAAAMIAERDAHGKFSSIADLASRVAAKSFNKKGLEALIKSGATDSLGERNHLLAGMEQILAYHKDAVKDVASGQSNLFAGGGEASAMMPARGELKLRAVPPATKREKLMWERELLGLYVSEHPFREYAEYFGGTLVNAADLPSKKGQPGLINVGGIIMDVRQIFTKKKNEPMAFVKLEDITGTIEVVVFPSVYKLNAHAIVKDAAVLVEGKFDEKDGEPKLLAEKLTPLGADNLEQVRTMLSYASRSDARATGAMSVEKSQISIAVPPTMAPSVADELKKIFSENPGSRRVFLKVKNGAVVSRIETSYSIAFSGDAIASIEKLVGKGAVLQE
jgi:DNA polymerase-3 subunit alpha